MSPPSRPGRTSRSTAACTWARAAAALAARALVARALAARSEPFLLKVCIVGAGAIGGFIGTRLALEGSARVSALARGTTLVALRDHGWRLLEGGAMLQAPLALASDDAAELGPQDLVIVALKGPALPSLAPSLTPLFGAGTIRSEEHTS